MTAERDIAGTALSFGAGTAAAMLYPAYFHAGHTPAVTLCLAGLTICLRILIHPRHTRLNLKPSYFLIFLTVSCCGFLTGLTDGMIQTYCGREQFTLYGAAADFGMALKKGISELPFENKESNAIISALVTGDRSMLTYETVSSFRESGASHILALSGLHLGIIYGFLKLLLLPLGRSGAAKVSRALLTIATCGFYTLATGAGASISRAFLFILLGETADLSGRHRSTRTILWSALLLQLFTDPSGITDIGFQLSYAAMLGIAYILPYLKRFWPTGEGIADKGLRWIWASASMSIACQITTGPLAWIYFGTFPKYFLLTNLIAVPLVGMIIPSSLIVLILDSCGTCPEIFTDVTEWMIGVLTACLETIASL